MNTDNQFDKAWHEILGVLSDAAIAADLRGNIIYANPAAETLLGWPAGQLVGQSLNIIQPERLRAIHNQAFVSFVSRGHLLPLANRAVRVPAQRRDGSELDIELSLTTLDQGGKKIVLGVLRDLTERVELERQLQVTEQLRIITGLAAELSKINEQQQLLQVAADTLADKLGLNAVGLWWLRNDMYQARSASMPELEDLSVVITRLEDIDTARRLQPSDNWPSPPTEHGAILPLRSEEACDGLLAVFCNEPITDELIEVLNVFSSLLSGSLNNVSKLERELNARQSAEQAQAQLAFLDHASEQMIETPDLDKRRSRLVRLCVPHLGDWAALYVADTDPKSDSLRLVAAHHVQTDQLARLRRSLSRASAPTELHLSQALSQQQPIVVALSRPTLARTVMVLPLHVRGGAAGVLVVGYLQSVPDETKMRVGRELTRHAALALDNVRLWQEHHRSTQDHQMAQEALAGSERRFRAVMEAAPNAIVAISLDGIINYANPQTEITFGYSLDELLGNPIEMLLPQQVRNQHRQHRENFFKAPAARPMGIGRDLAGRHKDGHNFPVEISLSPVETAQGAQVFATVVDITSRKQFEADLRHSRDQLAAILTGVADGIVVQDRRGRAVFANPAALNLLGYENLAQLQALSLTQIAKRFDVRDEQGRPLPVWRLPGAKLRRNGEGSEMLVHLREWYGTRDRWFAVQASDVRDSSGRLDLVINIFRDVTDTRRHQERSDFLSASSAMLGESLEYTETLNRVAHMAVPQMADWCAVDVLEQDQDYTSEPQRLAVAHIDPAKIELAKRLAEQVKYDPYAPNGISAVLRSGKSEMISQIPPELLEAATAGRDQEYIMLVDQLQLRSYLCVPMRSQGKVLGALTWVYAESGRRYDAEDLRLAEEVASRAAMAIENARLYQHAQDSVREREDFLAVASHELRTPVTIIRAYSQLLMRQLQGNRDRLNYARLEQHTDNIDKGAIRLTGLIDQLLDITSLQAEDERLDLVSLSLSELLESVVEDTRILQQRGLHTGVGMKLEVSDELYGFWDASRLQRVFANLIDNALKYSARGDEVIIRAWGENTTGKEYVHVTISDSGIGVPSAQQHTIFEPFKRGSNASTRNYSGFGMGLAVSRQIVDVHGGRIWVNSRGASLGSVFHVSLPRETEQVEASADEDSSDHPV